MDSEAITCEAVMKTLVSAVLLCLLLGCSPTGGSVSGQVSNLIMPATEHPNLSAVEIVLEINDTSIPPPGVPEMITQTLKEFRVVSAANATYTWGDPDGFLLIDTNIHRFTTAEAAKKNVLGKMEGIERLEGIGDVATIYGGQSLSFSIDTVKVTLTTISDEVDIRSVAAAYSDWLAAN